MKNSERLKIMADAYKKSGEIYKEVTITPEGYEALLHAIDILKWEEHVSKEVTCRWGGTP